MSPRKLFEQELEELREDVTLMGRKVEEGYDKLFEALAQEDMDAVKSMKENDRAINDLQRSIEAKCLTLLTRQQPVAGDLRMVSACLKVVTDIERVGDHVSDMAELFVRLSFVNLSEYSRSLRPMIEATKKMIHEAVDAFVGRKTEDAKEVMEFDDVVDEYFNKVKEDLIKILKEERKSPDEVVDVLMIAKYLEKIGDHAVNIGEWELFRETGNIQDIRLL